MIWVLVCLLGCWLLLATVAPAYRTPAGDEGIRTVRIFDLLRAFPRATVLSGGPRYVGRGQYSVGGEMRAGLFLHPSASAKFPSIRVSREAILTFKVGVMDQAWDKPGDGVEFTVFVERPNDSQTKVFSRYIDPKHNPGDRRWFDERIPLRKFGDQDVRVTLATGPGPANDFTDDWAVWIEPQIVLSSEN